MSSTATARWGSAATTAQHTIIVYLSVARSQNLSSTAEHVILFDAFSAKLHNCNPCQNSSGLASSSFDSLLFAVCPMQLTRLLEDSLGGSSKTLLVVNCR